MLENLTTRLRNAARILLYNRLPPVSPFKPYLIQPAIGQQQFKFWITDKTSQAWYDNSYDPVPLELQLLKAITRPHFHVLEIGLHTGFHAALFTQLLGPEAKYFGVEMMPASCVATMAQLQLNGAGDRFQVTHAAAGNRVGTVSYYDVDTGEGMVNAEGKGVAVRQIPPDSLLPALNNRVDLLKIDVEGYEDFVLAGCGEILEQHPSIALELHFSEWYRYGTKLEDILQRIPWQAYHAFFFCNAGSINNVGKEPVEQLKVFDATKLPAVGNANLFLFARRDFPDLNLQTLRNE